MVWCESHWLALVSCVKCWLEEQDYECVDTYVHQAELSAQPGMEHTYVGAGLSFCSFICPRMCGAYICTLFSSCRSKPTGLHTQHTGAPMEELGEAAVCLLTDGHACCMGTLQTTNKPSCVLRKTPCTPNITWASCENILQIFQFPRGTHRDRRGAWGTSDQLPRLKQRAAHKCFPELFNSKHLEISLRQWMRHTQTGLSHSHCAPSSYSGGLGQIITGFLHKQDGNVSESNTVTHWHIFTNTSMTHMCNSSLK